MFYLVFLFFLNPLRAEICQESMDAKRLISVAMDRYLDVEVLRKESKMIEGYITHAERVTNPELEHFTTTGDQFGRTNVTSETRLWFHLQTNNKRRKRADVFRADKKINEVNLEVARTELARDLFLAIMRNKQLLDEQRRIASIHDTINDLLRRYQGVNFLSPEQTLEKGSLEIANEELELNLTQLKNELFGLNKFFQTVTQSECDVSLSFKKDLKENDWPDLADFGFRPERSLSTRLSELALEKSKLEFTREEAMAYPDVRIGPMWQLNKLGSQEYNLFGVGLIVPIPSTDLNRGMRAATQVGIERSQKFLDFNQQEKAREFQLNHRRYMALYRQVMEFRKAANFQAQILENKSLFKRGLISIPLFLTYKREQIGLLNKVNTLELDLGSYLADLYIVNALPLTDKGLEVLNL